MPPIILALAGGLAGAVGTTTVSWLVARKPRPLALAISAALGFSAGTLAFVPGVSGLLSGVMAGAATTIVSSDADAAPAPVRRAASPDDAHPSRRTRSRLAQPASEAPPGAAPLVAPGGTLSPAATAPVTAVPAPATAPAPADPVPAPAPTDREPPRSRGMAAALEGL